MDECSVSIKDKIYERTHHLAPTPKHKIRITSPIYDTANFKDSPFIYFYFYFICHSYIIIIIIIFYFFYFFFLI